MNAIKKINDVKQLVRSLLIRYDHYRDCDEKLCAHIWARQLGVMGYNMKSMSAHEFLILYAEGKLTSSMSVERARRKEQELNPELRGKKWVERHQEEKEVRQNINERPELFPNF